MFMVSAFFTKHNYYIDLIIIYHTCVAVNAHITL